jgi:hypothetical protein
MRNAEEFPGRRSGLRRMRLVRRQSIPGAGGEAGPGRIRYAHTGALQRDEPYCTVGLGVTARHTSGAGAEAGPGGPTLGGTDLPGPGLGGPGLGESELSGPGLGGPELGGEAWPPVFAPASRRTDLWVLVCGGVAAAAAFAAAFVAAGGVAHHPASPETMVPAVVSQACPSPAPSPVP